MATSGMYPGSIQSAPRIVALPQQKKIMDDVLECIIQLKSEFFENHQPINDDNVILQRLCAKLEHLIQIGMREKTSLLGRKKDYWDYFCDCLGSAKGSNDGIRYVKNLRENKTSLGRGRAFVRFCLVHQRLADALQQCLVHSEKTSLWFVPSSVLCNAKDSNTLISALYDLNSMHFDLSPRGYDLDSDWPSFSNRKMTPGGSWNIPISRRSSITSMDTISQASISIAASPDVDKLHKDLEAAHSARYDAQEQLGALQKEKEEVSQSAWESQGKVAALQEQLNIAQSQLASLQDQYRELDVNFVKMKLEKDHFEKLLSDERKNAEEQESKRVQQLQGEEEVWKREMREEGERRRKEIDKLQEDLRTKTEEEEEGKKMLSSYCDSLVGLMSEFQIQTNAPKDFVINLGYLRQSLDGMQTQTASLMSEKDSCNSQAATTVSDNEKLSKEVEKQHQELATVRENLETLHSQIASLESKLDEKGQECKSLNAKIMLNDKDSEKCREEIESLRELNQELKDKEKTLKDLNKTMKERILSDYSKSLSPKAGTDTLKYLESVLNRDKQVLELQQQMLVVERDITNQVHCKVENKEEGGNNHVKTIESLKKLKLNLDTVLSEGEDKFRLMLSEMQAMEKKSVNLKKEVDMLEHGGQVLNEHLTLSEAKVEFFSTKLKDEEAKLAEMTASHEEMIAKMKGEDDGRVTVEKEKNELKSHVDKLSTEIDSSHKEKEELKTQLEKIMFEKQKLAEDLRIAQNGIDKMEVNLSNEREKIAHLLRDCDGEKDSKAKILEQISKLQAEKEEMTKEKEDLTSNFVKEICELKEKLEKLESDQQKSLLDIESLKNTAYEEQDKAKSQISEILKENFEILDLLNNGVLLASKHCGTALKLNLQENDRENSDQGQVEFSQGGNDKHNALIMEAKTNVKALCDRVKDLCESHDKLEEVTTNQISAVLEEEKDRLLSEVDAALEETHHIKSQLEQTSELLTVSNSSLDTISTEKESLQSKISSLTEEILQHETEKNNLQSKVSVMVEEISRHEAEKDELRREMSVLKADCERAEDDVQEKLGQKRQLEVKLEEIEEKLEEALSENSKLEKAAEGLYSQSEFSHKVLEESLTDSQTALEAMKAEKMELEDKCFRLEKEKKTVDEKLQAAMDTCISLKEELENVQKSSDSDDEVASLKQKLEEEKVRYELEIDTLNSELSSLQFQMSSAYIEEQAETQEGYSVTATQSSIEELEAEVKQLEEENEKLRKMKEEEEDKQNVYCLKIESLEGQLGSYEKTMMELQTLADEAESSKEEMSLELTQLQLSAKKRLEDRDKELEILRSDNEGMKRQILKLIKDKDNLWQKTDALVDEKKRKDRDRWMDNSKVTHCGLCKAEFSLFLRKHHCRLCGSIFCWSCSDYWLDTAHSSKKARVCKACFDQKTNPDSSLMATSLIENDSENEDEESNVSTSSSFMHTFNEEGNVEIREVLPSGATQRLKKNDGDDTNETDEGKLMQSFRRSPSIDSRKDRAKNNATGISAVSRLPYEMETDSLEDSIYNANAEIRVSIPKGSSDGFGADGGGDNGDGDDDDLDDSVYQLITQAEVAKTMKDYKTANLPVVPPQTNMNSSMLLSADDLETGDVNRQNEVWIKPGRQYGVPIKIGGVGDGYILSWEFSSQPKDIVFSIQFCAAEDNSLSKAEEIVAPCKCDAHKQMHRGELTPKMPGIYTLIFDNTYSRMTSKKVHYHLEYRKSP